MGSSWVWEGGGRVEIQGRKPWGDRIGGGVTQVQVKEPGACLRLPALPLPPRKPGEGHGADCPSGPPKGTKVDANTYLWIE